jgi:hypothetical protein
VGVWTVHRHILRMAESHVISALKDKRAELSGEVLKAESRIDKLRLDIAAIDRALGIFDPTVIPRSIKPIMRRPRLTRIKQGAWTLAVLDVLRQSDRPMAASEIAALVAKQFGEPYCPSSEHLAQLAA